MDITTNTAILDQPQETTPAVPPRLRARRRRRLAKPAQTTSTRIAFYPHEKDTRPRVETLTDTELRDKFKDHETREDKHGGRQFSFAELRPGTRRADENVIKLHALVFDIDDVDTAFLERVRQQCADFKYIIYSSNGNTENNTRFRLIIFLSRPILVEEFSQVWNYGVTRFCLDKADTQCDDPQRAYWLPSCKRENKDAAFSYWHDGKLFDPAIAITQIPAKKNERVSAVSASAHTPPKTATPELAEKLLKRYLKKVNDGEPRNRTGYDLAQQYWHEGFTEADQNTYCFKYQSAVQNKKDHEYTRSEIETSIAKVRENPRGEPAIYATVNKSYGCTDVGLAERFADEHSGKLRFVHEKKKWLIWNGQCWKFDNVCAVQDLVIQTIRGMYPKQLEDLSSGDIERLAKFARYSESAGHMAAALKTASALPQIRASVFDLDTDPYKLTCGNGTLNLADGTFGPANPADLITKHTPINYDPNAECPQFLRFLERIQPDPEIRAYLQQCIGYMLTGDISEQKVLIWYGPGSSGKSTLQNICLKLAGAYGLQATSDLLLHRANEHFAMTATLKGKRMVFSSEPERGAKLATARIKEWSGGEKISANEKYETPYEFTPTFKLIMTTNFLPRVSDNDYAIWRRLHVIPFTETIKGAELDKRLSQKLESELPGILAWAVQGCRQWRATGLVEPPAIVAATKMYRSAEDRIQGFLTARTVDDLTERTPLKILYESYQAWADAEHEPLMPKDEFRAMLEGRGYVRTLTGGVVKISGLRLKI